MKSVLKYILVGSMTLTCLTSCNDILDKAPLTEISEADLWSDPALAQAFVNARYNQIGTGWTESMLAACTDEAEICWDRGCDVVNQAAINSGDLGRLNGAWWGWDNRSWGTKWNNISNCNIFLERVNDIKFEDEQLKKRLIAEVHFIRAFEYNDLVTRWGGVPIITRSFTLDDTEIIAQQERASYPEMVEFMVSELDAAAADLPNTYGGSDYGRATRIAALALKSRILLFAASDLMNDGVKQKEVGYLQPDANRWKKAADAAQTALNEALSAGYGLYAKKSDLADNFYRLFLDTSASNNEVLFGRYGTDGSLGQAVSCIDQYNGPNGYGGWGANCPTQDLADAYEIVEDGVARFIDWKSDDAKHPYENRDPRFYATILYDGAPWMGREVELFSDVDNSGKEVGTGGKDSKFGDSNWNTSFTGYNLKKFMDEKYVQNSWNTPAKVFIWLRVAELYLNLAEARCECGQYDLACDALNAVRARVGMPEIHKTGDELMQAIRHERRVEFAYEEHRFYDVRRWKEGFTYFNHGVSSVDIKRYPDGHKEYIPGDVRGRNAGLGRKFTEKMYWCPIPRSEMEKAPRFVQNPNYTD